MRPLSPTRRSLPRVLVVIGVLLLLPAVPHPARADDIVRRTQEELRKRNLYFGDIDGVPNRGTIGALRRYQERKRLAVTGEIDPDTLRSLGIPAPNSNAASAPLEPDPWPEVPVLKSDLARRPPPLAGETVLGEDPAALPPPNQGGDDTLSHADPPSPVEPDASETPSVSPALTPSTPSAPPETREAATLTPEEARAFIQDYLRDGASNDLTAEMAHYADEVDYFNKGPANRDYIRQDVSSYYKRWTERRYDLVGPVSTSPGTKPGDTSVRFVMHFVCRGRDQRAEGRTTNLFILRRYPSGEVRIVGMKEQRQR